jgi:hypothetical protein
MPDSKVSIYGDITADILNGVPNSKFGYSISFNSEGNIALVGAPYENGNTGAAYVHTLSNGVWTQTARLSSEMADGYFGNKVSLNATGTVALIGSFFENNGTGAAYIYSLSNKTWTQIARLSSEVANSIFGCSVRINSAGNTAIIGAQGDTDNTGAVFIYTLTDGTWAQTARLDSGVASSDFGKSVSIDSTGTLAIIGANAENNYTGASYIYTLSNESWTQTARLNSRVANSDFGWSTSINSDGTVALIGAQGENENTGAAYIYKLSNGIWSQTARLSGGVPDSWFGCSVSLNEKGDVALIVAWDDDKNTGVAYIYELSNGTWTQKTKLTSGITGAAYIF